MTSKDNVQICPHTHRVLRNLKDLPKGADTQRCPVCYTDWFSVNENGALVVPVVMEHCGHVICHFCFQEQRSLNLACVFPWCGDQNGIAPLNLITCEECQTFDEHFEQPSRPDKQVLTVRQHMLDLLTLELRDLAEDAPDLFKIPRDEMSQLTKYWRKALYDFEGQYHRWSDLAEILDPFRGADVVHDEVVQTYDEPRLRAMPTKPDRGYLAADPSIADQFPKRIEPWVSTVIRTVLHRINEEEGHWVPYSLYAQRMPRHDKHRDQNEDEDGVFVLDWPVKRILAHRLDEEGQVEYQVQYIGATLPSELQWKPRSEIARKKIWQKYDAEHGITATEDQEPLAGEKPKLPDEESLDDSGKEPEAGAENDSDDETGEQIETESEKESENETKEASNAVTEEESNAGTEEESNAETENESNAKTENGSENESSEESEDVDMTDVEDMPTEPEDSDYYPSDTEYESD